MIKDVVQVDKDLVFGDSARRGAHFVHVSCRYATNWGFLDPAELAQQPRSEPVNQRVGAWNAARRAAGSTLSDVDLEKEFAEQLCALRSACQAPVLPQGSSWLVNILSQKLRMCAEQKKLEDCQRVMNKEQDAPSSTTNRPDAAAARLGDLAAACQSDEACVAFASFLRDNPGAHGTVSLAVRTAEDVLNGKFDKLNVMRRVLHLHRLCEMAAADGAARAVRAATEQASMAADEAAARPAAASSAVPAADASPAATEGVVDMDLGGTSGCARDDVVMEGPQFTNDKAGDALFTGGNEENVSGNILATPVTAEAARKRGLSAT